MHHLEKEQHPQPAQSEPEDTPLGVRAESVQAGGCTVREGMILPGVLEESRELHKGRLPTPGR